MRCNEIDVVRCVIKPLEEYYGHIGDKFQDRMIDKLVYYSKRQLEVAIDELVDNHAYKRPPTIAEIRKYIPSDSFGANKARGQLKELSDKQDSYKQRAEQYTKDFLLKTDLGRDSISESWRDHLRNVVYNLAFVQVQALSGCNGWGWDSTSVPVPQAEAKVFVDNIAEEAIRRRSISVILTEEHIEFIKNNAF